jgi:hypothetical protein
MTLPASPSLPQDVRQLLFVAGFACVAMLPSRADNQQIPAGTIGSLTTKQAAPPKTKRILDDALTAKTRAALQAAMDSVVDVK